MKPLRFKLFCLLTVLQAYFTKAEIKSVTIGEDVQLECAANVNIHQILALTWIKDDTSIVHLNVEKHQLLEMFPSKYKLIELTKLIILDVNQTDLGRYHCVISSSEGFVPGEFFELRAADPPTTIFAKVGDNVHLDCPVGLTADFINVEWMRNNHVVMQYTRQTDEVGISSSEKYGRHGNSSLKIMEIQISDSGDYTCTMSTGSIDAPEIMHKRYKLFIPVLQMNDCQDVHGTDGCDCYINGTTHRSLTCEATGFPEPPLITWANQTGEVMTESVISWTSTINLDLESENSIITCHAQSLTSHTSFTAVTSVCVIFSNANSDTPPVLMDSSGGWRATVIVLCIIVIVGVLTWMTLHMRNKPFKIIELPRTWYYKPASSGPETEQHKTGGVMRRIKELFLDNKSNRDNTVINDPIHGTIKIPEYCQLIIDTPEFQRLRYIKQLGCVYYVYHTAGHTRFDHAIGVSYLAGKVATGLRSHDNSITKTDVACVEIAGLCHDLGHGPFSHLFQSIAVTSEPDKKWTHEEYSTVVFKHLIEKNALSAKMGKHGIRQKEIDFICNLMLGEENSEPSHHDKYFLYQIVNNRLNGVDVDKWDYLTRDSNFLGIPSAFDLNKLSSFLRVFGVEMESGEIRKELCYRDKIADELNNMFQTRRKLHYQAYQHRVVRSIRIMITDAFIAASRHLIFPGKDGTRYSLLESINDPEAFCQVNDSVIYEIMRSQSQEEGMVTARQILKRIHKRELYQCIVEIKQADKKMHSTDPDKIKQHLMNDEEELDQSNDDNTWHARNCEADVSRFDYGQGNNNPLLSIPFYGKSTDEEMDKVLSVDLPERLTDVTVRIYTKLLNPSETDIKTAKDVFYKRCRALIRHDNAPPATPEKQIRVRHGKGTHSEETTRRSLLI